MSERPFKFGVQFSKALPPGELKEKVAFYESIGMDAVYFPDHFDDQLAPFSVLGYLSNASRRIRVGTLVLDNDFWHPITVAREAATLQWLSGGRLVLGIGAGWMRADYEASGIAMDPPATRVARLEEAVLVIKGLLANEEFSHRGRFYELEGARVYPRLGGLVPPPLLIGGGSRRILSFAASQADIVNVNVSLRAGAINEEVLAGLVPEKFDERCSWVQEAAGDRLGSIDIQCLTFVVRVARDGKAERERLASYFGVDPDLLSWVPLVLVGTASEIRDMLLERRERWGFNYIVLHETDPIEELAPVIEELTSRAPSPPSIK